MSQWQIGTIGDLCIQDRVTVRPGEFSHLPYLGLENIEAETGRILPLTQEDCQSVTFRFGPEHVLYGKLRPYLNKVTCAEFEGRCSTEIVPLKPRKGILREYLCFAIRREEVAQAVTAKNTGSRMPRANMEFLLSLPIPLPPLPEQRRIVDLLNHAAGIRRLRRQALDTTRQLIPALFVEMFSEPGRNERGWEVVPLSAVADIGSGVTKGRNLIGQETVELPYLRVANVQDGRLELSDVKIISVKPSEVERLSLLPGDLLMTEGGDPDKLGRCALWSGEVTPCLHQNHVFRVRCHRAVALPEYVRALVGSWYGKRYFLKVAKQTTGIASINKTQLSGFPVLLPPLALQQTFEERCADARSLITQQERHLDQADALLQSLMARYFGGAGDGVGATHASPEPNVDTTRARHASPLQQSFAKGPVGADGVRPGRIPCAPTQDLPIAAETPTTYTPGGQAALPAANQPVPGGIPARLLAAMQTGRACGRAELLTATGITEADWTWAIRQLKEERKVVQEGGKRGAQYRRS